MSMIYKDTVGLQKDNCSVLQQFNLLILFSNKYNAEIFIIWGYNFGLLGFWIQILTDCNIN